MNPPPDTVLAISGEAALETRHAVETGTELDHWVHEFRNALGNVLMAAGTARIELADNRPESASMLMRRVEEGCDRCLRLLETMPR